MPYTPDATDVTNPIEGTVKAVTAAAEFRTVKLYMRDVLLAGLNAKAPLASPALTGSVGINMPSPVSALQLGGTNPVLTIGKQNDGVSYYTALKIWSQYNTTIPSTQISQDTNGTYWGYGGRLELRDAFAASAVRMCVDTVGNVGIGTSTPNAKLEISHTGGALGSDGLRLGTSMAFGGSHASALAWYNTHASFLSKLAAIQVMTSGVSQLAGEILFATNNGSSLLERMRIDNVGGVGINTAAHASALLDIQSTNKGFRLPNMTTAQKNAIISPAAGLMVFDTTLGKACLYTGSAWQTITSV